MLTVEIFNVLLSNKSQTKEVTMQTWRLSVMALNKEISLRKDDLRDNVCDLY